jgi:hypothetical protein
MLLLLAVLVAIKQIILLLVVNDFFFFVFVLCCLMKLNADLEGLLHFLTSPVALYFECWLDTELANTDKERSVVVKGGAIIIFNFNSKLVQSKE